MNSQELQTPILRMVTSFYGYMGVNLQKVQWNSLPSVLLLLWTLSLDGLVFYGLFTIDLFRPMLLESCTSVKPLFAFFIELSILYIYPGMFLINTLFYVFYSPAVLYYLDSICFYRVYHSEKHARRQMIFLVTMTHSAFGLAIMYRFVSHPASWAEFNEKLWMTLHSYLCLYIINIYQFSVCVILHYYQSATLRLLKRAEVSLSTGKVLPADEDQTLAEISALATSNFALNQRLSFPLIAYIIINLFNIILALCVSLVCKPNPSMLVHSLCIWIYLTYLASLNHQILHTLKRIVERLKSNYENYGSDSIRQTVIATTLRPHSLGSNRGRQLRFTQVDIYIQYFPIKIFHFTKMSLPFILQTVLFTLNYVVLITQTN